MAGELMNRCKLFVLNVCHVEWDGPSSCMASSDDIVVSFERGLYLAILCPSSSQYYPLLLFTLTRLFVLLLGTRSVPVTIQYMYS